MSFSQPQSQDPAGVAGTQQGYNLEAAQLQNKNNSYNQTNPYGSVSYVADANSPSGYSINTSLSAPFQSLFNTQTTAANNIANNAAGMYASPFDLNASTGQTANLLNSWNQQYLSPIFKQQQSNLDAQLQNQGLAPGSEAFNNAQNLLARNQGDVTNQYLTQNEGQAFNQALTQYQLPIQTINMLKGATPSTPTFGATPTAQIQPANYAAAAQNNFQNQQNQFLNTISGVGQLGGMFAGGWA